MSLSGYTKEFKYNFKIAYPVILGMLGHIPVGFVDNVMMGKVGITELGAAALGNTAILITMPFTIGFSVAIISLVAMNDEAGDKQAAQSILNHSMLLNIISSAVLFLLMFFVEPIMHITGQSEKVVALAAPYTYLAAFSFIPLGVFSSSKQFADGLSMTKHAMYVTLLTNLINVFGNYLFIYDNWGCPKLGVLGVGIGTLISCIAMPIMLYYMLKYLLKTEEYVIHTSFRHIGKATLRKISNIGLPTGLQMISEIGVFSVAIWISGMLGKNQLSTNQIALNSSTMTFIVASGSGITAMIRVGSQLGAKSYANLHRVAISVFSLVLCIQVFFTTLSAVLRNWLSLLYLEMDNAEKAANSSLVIAEAANLLLIAAIFQVSNGLQVTALGALRGLQNAKISMRIIFIAYWPITFPIPYVLGVRTSLGNIDIWTDLLVGFTAATVCLLYRFDRISLRLIKNGCKTQN